MTDNFWLGSNELVIVYDSGSFKVLERFEDYEPVFNGSYDQCRKLCHEKELDYLESNF